MLPQPFSYPQLSGCRALSSVVGCALLITALSVSHRAIAFEEISGSRIGHASKSSPIRGFFPKALNLVSGKARKAWWPRKLKKKVLGKKASASLKSAAKNLSDLKTAAEYSAADPGARKHFLKALFLPGYRGSDPSMPGSNVIEAGLLSTLSRVIIQGPTFAIESALSGSLTRALLEVLKERVVAALAVSAKEGATYSSSAPNLKTHNELKDAEHSLVTLQRNAQLKKLEKDLRVLTATLNATRRSDVGDEVLREFFNNHEAYLISPEPPVPNEKNLQTTDSLIEPVYVQGGLFPTWGPKRPDFKKIMRAPEGKKMLSALTKTLWERIKRVDLADDLPLGEKKIRAYDIRIFRAKLAARSAITAIKTLEGLEE